MEPRVRVTGILVEDGEILLTEERVTDSRGWSLPGGGLEQGETMEECIVREMKEETGLEVSVGDLLYLCDNLRNGEHIVHITFLVTRTGGMLGTGNGPEFTSGKIRSVRFVPLGELVELGFSKIFVDLATGGFPNRGSYRGIKRISGCDGSLKNGHRRAQSFMNQVVLKFSQEATASIDRLSAGLFILLFRVFRRGTAAVGPFQHIERGGGAIAA